MVYWCVLWEGVVYNAEPVIAYVEMIQMFCPCRESNRDFSVITDYTDRFILHFNLLSV
jgi:hypothetical protein